MLNYSPWSAAPRPLNLAPIKAALFDLDGTLINVDMQQFVPAYLRRLAGRLANYADPQRTVRTLHDAVMSMLAGTAGECSLEEVLRTMLAEQLQLAWPDYQAGLAAFCREDLDALRPLIKPHPLARALVTSCVARGWRVALATNPIFPRAVIEARLAWGGLADLPFQPVTSYETSRHCKPHAGFFTDLLAELDLEPQACLMVGNDTLHDLAAARIGLPTCLLTTWRIDRPGSELPADWEGQHHALLELLREPSPAFPHD
jgi:FMN phosphatase YigB (HAD superfamily)